MTGPLVLVPTAAPSAAAPTPGEAPRSDYVEIAKALDAQLAYAPPFEGLLGHLENRLLHVHLRQAWRARRSRPTLLLSLSEQVGLPLACLGTRRAPHVLVAHNLMTPLRQRFQQVTRYLDRIDKVVVLSRAQEQHLVREAGVPAHRVHFVHDKVDHRFFAPGNGSNDGYVLSVGQEQRDYATLLDAVKPLDAPVVILPSSTWWDAPVLPADGLPANVEVRRRLTYEQLRSLYERAAVVVVPLLPEVRYAAGVNAVLEAMAMGKPLVVTSTPGIIDYVSDGETARLVPPADPQSLRGAIVELLTDSSAAAQLGMAGRRVVEGGRNLDSYVAAIRGISSGLLDR